MSKFRESEGVIGRCSSEKGALKNFTNHTGKTPMLGSPPIKLQALRSVASLKRDCNTGAPLQTLQNVQEHPSLQNTSDDSSFWRKAKYDFSLKVRAQFLYSRAKTGGITLN